MGKSTKKIVASIIEKYTDFYITDDLNVDPDWIIAKMNDVRASLIREDYKRKSSLAKYYSKTCCIDVECAKPGCTIGGVTVESGDVLWLGKLPSLVGGIGEANIKYLGGPGLNKQQEYTRKSFDGFNSSEGNIWTSSKPMYTIVDTDAMLKNSRTSGLSFLCLIGILQDPTSACDWNLDEDDYPVVSAYKLELLVFNDLVASKSIPKDMSQNTSEEEKPQQVQQQKR